MIKTISSISNISSIELCSSDISHLPLNSLSFDDTIIGSGGFGNVYKIENINELKTQNYLLKIIDNTENQDHAFRTISILHTKLKKLIPKNHNLVAQIYPELLGLPIIAFIGITEADANPILGLLMHDLSVNNYNDFGSDSFDKRKYFELDITDKIYFGYQLAKCISLMHEINFIHSDLSENAIWINFNTTQLALIDYDSGFHHDLQKKPTTIGKIGQWIGSRYRKILSNEDEKDNLTLNERIQEENWVLANSIFEIIFGISPFFFLIDALNETKAKYLKEFEWPHISLDSKIFNKNNEDTYLETIKRINYLEQNGVQELIKAFKKVINKGFKNENNRLSAKEWKDILYNICVLIDVKPQIRSFNADKIKVSSNVEEVKLSWETQKGNLVYINNILINSDYHILTFQESQIIKITVLNDFGEANSSIQIEAIKLNPIINIFTSNIEKRTNLNPVILSWETENTKYVILENAEKHFLPNDNYEVNPSENTTYILKAIGHFGQEVSQKINIDVVSAKISEFDYKINIEKGIDNIDLFWETENTTEVNINPRIGNVAIKGKTCVGISEKTVFTLTAKGYFNEVSKTIETKPFPIPLIKGVFVPTPIISINVVVPENNLKIPDVLLNMDSTSTENILTSKGIPSHFIKLECEINNYQNNKSTWQVLTQLFDNLFKKIIK
jgi:serine/threonine protein kinase